MLRIHTRSYFAEYAILMLAPLHPATIVAVTFSDLFSLSREDFENTVSLFPSLYEKVYVSKCPPLFFVPLSPPPPPPSTQSPPPPPTHAPC